MTEMVEVAELANYRWWDEPKGVSWTRFNHMEDTAVTPTDNKRYTKVDEYEAFLDEEKNSIEYKEKLIDYDEDYESYDHTWIGMGQRHFTKEISKNARYKWVPADQANQLASAWQYSSVINQFDLVCFLKRRISDNKT